MARADGLSCGACGCTRLEVIDSRPATDARWSEFGAAVRRRRRCTGCGLRVTTLEIPAERLEAWRREAVRSALARLLEAVKALAA